MPAWCLWSLAESAIPIFGPDYRTSCRPVSRRGGGSLRAYRECRSVRAFRSLQVDKRSLQGLPIFSRHRLGGRRTKIWRYLIRQMRTAPSRPPEPSKLPSWLNATVWTTGPWPRNWDHARSASTLSTRVWSKLRVYKALELHIAISAEALRPRPHSAESAAPKILPRLLCFLPHQTLLGYRRNADDFGRSSLAIGSAARMTVTNPDSPMSFRKRGPAGRDFCTTDLGRQTRAARAFTACEPEFPVKSDRWSRRIVAISAVHPVWWLAPTPRPLSP